MKIGGEKRARLQYTFIQTEDFYLLVMSSRVIEYIGYISGYTDISGITYVCRVVSKYLGYYLGVIT